ncbi:MAG: diaminopimelate epimerase [Peptococcaceae bacterium]|jgi:diaminopimelate epimerase|nr:diaminopimelate epimerase [Peptococcaceae bacterium]
MHFTKVQGLGNDFILVDGFSEKLDLERFPELAVKICDRHFGVGADGLVPLLPSETADVFMRIFNSDGSEAEMCGNAIRCAAKYLYERGLVRKRRILVETLAGMRVPELIIDNGKVALVRVDMGEPLLERGEIPMLGAAGRVVNEELFIDQSSYRITAVSMGNPHCIVFVPDLTAVELTQLGPRFENHPSFPRKTNVEFVQVLNRAEVRMAVWERGAGVTLACGTGACAVGVAGALNGFTNRAVTVHLSTGELYIEWAADNHVYMTGPAEEVFSGSYPIPE